MPKTNKDEPVFLTEKAAKSAGIPYIKEVAERAGMYDREIIAELFRKNYKFKNNLKEDGNALLEVILEAYKKELLVYYVMEKMDTQISVPLPALPPVIKPNLSWKNVFYSEHKIHGDISIARKLAVESGYPMYCWNGRVYSSNEENTMKDLGTLEDLGLV